MEPPSTAGNGKRHVAPRGGRARVAPPPGLGAVEWTQLAVAAAYVAATAGLEWLVGRRGASLDVAFAPARGDLFSAKSVATGAQQGAPRGRAPLRLGLLMPRPS